MCGACEDMLMMLFCLHQGKNWKPQNQNWIQPKSWSIQMLRIQLRSVLKLWKKLNSLKHKVKHTSVSRTAARKRNTAALDPDLSWSLQRFQISAVFLKLCFVEWSSVTGNNLYFETFFFLFNFPLSRRCAQQMCFFSTSKLKWCCVNSTICPWML